MRNKAAAILFMSIMTFSLIAFAEAQGEKFKLEVFSGISIVSPSDLNRNVDYLNDLDRFFFDDYLNFLAALDQNDIRSITGWEKSAGGSLQKISKGFPFGARLKYSLSKRFALSLGVTYLSGSAASAGETTYLRTHYATKRDQETLRYDPFTLSFSGIVPSLGVHFRFPINSRIGFEAYVTGGPLLASCQSRYSRDYEWKVFYFINNSWNELPAMRDELYLEQKGSGAGIALELAGRLNYRLFPALMLFCDAGYAYQRVARISGSGSADRNGAVTEWEGTWKMRVEQLQTEWGTFLSEWPSNYWPDGNDFISNGNFALDLSGFYLRLGISVSL